MRKRQRKLSGQFPEDAEKLRVPADLFARSARPESGSWSCGYGNGE